MAGKGFQWGDPRAVEAGRKGGRESAFTRRVKRDQRSPEYRKGYADGYNAGFIAGRREQGKRHEHAD